MNERHPVLIAIARAVNAAFFVATATYCVLSYSAFAYYQFIRPELVTWLPDFVAVHSALFWLVLLITTLTMLPALARRRRVAVAYVAAGAVTGVGLVARPLLVTVGYSPRSLVLSILSVIPLVLLAGVDHALAGSPRWGAVRDDWRVAKSCGLAALLVWAMYAAAVPFRAHTAIGLQLSGRPLGVALLVALLAHVAIFTVLYLLLSGVASIGALARSPAVEYWGLALGSALVVTWLLHQVVCVALSFVGAASWAASSAFGFSLAATWSGVAWHKASGFGPEGATPLDVWLAPISTGRFRWLLAATTVALPFAAYGLTASVERFDWNFLVQKLLVLVAWLVAFGLVYVQNRPAARAARRPDGLVSASAVLVVFVLFTTLGERVRTWTGDVRLDAEVMTDAYAAVDPSFHLIRDLARTNSGDTADFFAFLKAHSLISAAKIRPLEVDFVRPFPPPGARLPHVFLFVVDSMRRDYVSAFNPAVTFTPSLGEFGRDSFVFDRAFTRYGGTGLAVPSIWAGGMLMHKQYVLPFTPMNTLSKLLDGAGYRRIMSYDSIVRALVPRTPDLVELDHGRRTEDLDLCGTLSELETQLAGTRTDPRPVFAYSLPQNVHMSVALFQDPMPAANAFPGFFAPVASEVHHIDGCFGTFIGYLKREGWYDDSVIILTSDHGDSLGEDGRFGHAYTIFPEVMRVPLIVHLPEWLKATVTTDVARPAFSTDITPTLYALLGYHPAALGPLYGEPLFVPRASAPADRHDAAFLLASSYGSVYGMLTHNGRALYIADAIEGRDYEYGATPGDDLGARVPVTESARTENRALIRQQISELSSSYHFFPGP